MRARVNSTVWYTDKLLLMESLLSWNDLKFGEDEEEEDVEWESLTRIW